eukprot:5399765-Pleurochrysis_carterae.AAC.1
MNIAPNYSSIHILAVTKISSGRLGPSRSTNGRCSVLSTRLRYDAWIGSGIACTAVPGLAAARRRADRHRPLRRHPFIGAPAPCCREALSTRRNHSVR